ncbi:MAG TPA: hypothetical protein VJQ78_14540 [Sphingobium sp.]|nr:hypothetical protein [Sphingobium sp.]
MSARGGLVAILMLMLTTGCRDSSGDAASAANVTVAPQILPANVAENAAAIEVVAAPLPSPQVTVNAQPAPLGSLDLPPSPDAAQATAFPQEVTSFMVDRDSCDHFRGEEPTDDERRVFLAENIAELCTGTDAKLALLRKRYANDPSVIAALRGYDGHIEAQP